MLPNALDLKSHALVHAHRVFVQEKKLQLLLQAQLQPLLALPQPLLALLLAPQPLLAPHQPQAHQLRPQPKESRDDVL